jgi:hypothetical protein
MEQNIKLKELEGYKIVCILKDLFNGPSYECYSEDKALDIIKEKGLNYHYIVQVYVKEQKC